MRAVCFDVTVPGFLLARSVGRLWRSAPFGALGTLGLRQVAAPALPGAEWVALEVLAGGVCGSDITTVTYSASPSLEPFSSFPAVLGHEILGRVVEKGAAVRGIEIGQRVNVNPMLSCAARGFEEPCRSCRDGHDGTCHHSADPGRVVVDGRRLGPGLIIGYHRDLPGAFGERVIAHQSALFGVPDQLPDDTAVLTEPLAIALHAVLGTRLDPAEPVLVIGSGAIALATVWALRATGFAGEILSQTKREHEARLAVRLGASENVRPGDEVRAALLRTGASAYKTILGAEVYAGGGFPVIFDCVGSAGSLKQALRFCATRGRVVVLGCAAEIPRLDLSFLWARELQVTGFVGYGMEQFRGQRRHTFEVAQQLLTESGDAVSQMVTHRFPLRDYRRALVAAARHRQSGAIKVLLEPDREPAP